MDKPDTFRFIDQHLQTSLIEAVKAAGLDLQVANDGTILSPPENSTDLELIIHKIIETVFPDGYYRAEITNDVKAARYRRFKQFNKTCLIEEISNGKTYFVQEQYEKLYRYRGMPTHISFNLVDKSLDPDRVTALLKLTPAFACHKGEPFKRNELWRRQDVPPRPSSQGWWELNSIPYVESNDLDLHLDWLIKTLQPAISALLQLSHESAEKDLRILQVDIMRPYRVGGVTLSSQTLQQLGNLVDRMDIRFWPDDYL